MAVMAIAITLLSGPTLARESVNVVITGISGDLLTNVQASLAIERRSSDENLDAMAIGELHERANKEIHRALEPFGYYRPDITVALVEPLKAVLQPLLTHIALAFVYGSVAKKSDTASSDIDLMIISDHLTYADVFPALEEVSSQLHRSVQPTIYSLDELNKRIQSDNSFIKRVLELPKIWIIGKESDLPAG